jgi:hypothetical protein
MAGERGTEGLRRAGARGSSQSCDGRGVRQRNKTDAVREVKARISGIGTNE